MFVRASRLLCLRIGHVPLKHCWGWILLLSFSAAMQGQSLSDLNLTRHADGPLPAFDVNRLTLPEAIAAETLDVPDSPASASSNQHHATAGSYARKILQDQKSLYLAPFKPTNFKWDLLVLAGTGALIAADRHIDAQLPGGNNYSTVSNVVIGTTASALAGTWLYGLKTGDSHAAELGYMEIESLINTFLIYTPMQFMAGRQRPGEGNGNGDFWQHHSLNTSFPAGHAMFTWDMAAVAAHEYPKTWVKILAYGAAATVTTTRWIGRDHWAGDTFAGAALGYFIGSHVFHTRCDPELDNGCSRPKGGGLNRAIQH